MQHKGVVSSLAWPSLPRESCGCKAWLLREIERGVWVDERQCVDKVCIWWEWGQEVVSVLTSSCNGGSDECVQLFITPDGKLQMTRRDPLQVKITWTVSCQLKNLNQPSRYTSKKIMVGFREQVTNFSSEIFQDGSTVHRCSCSNTPLTGRSLLQMSVNTTHRKLG